MPGLNSGQKGLGGGSAGLSLGTKGLWSGSSGFVSGGGAGVPPVAPVGFTLNGSTNTALKAMFAAKVGKIVSKGDSTTAGAGAAIVADGTTSTVLDQLTNARPYRPTAVLASLMTAGGYPASDMAQVSDSGCIGFSVPLVTYDPRFVGGADWFYQNDQSFAGGGFMGSTATLLKFTQPGIDRFEVVAFNTGAGFAAAFAVDAAAATILSAPGCTIAGNQVTLPSARGGFSTITIAAGALGTHELWLASNAGGPVFHSVGGYNSAAPGIWIINHASSGANSTNQAASNVGGDQWSNMEALAYQAPKLTIITLGLNDSDTGVYTANLNAIIAKAKLSGDVLIFWSNAANPSTFRPLAEQDALRNAASACAAAAGVAFGDIRAAMGDWASTAVHTADNNVHPNRGYYANIAQYQWNCIKYMLGA